LRPVCSDCHEPHGAKLRLPGDNVCLQCHASEKYAAATHHYHEGVSPRPGCPSCHMPTRTYMVVDPRHDHSFRIPRPYVGTGWDTECVQGPQRLSALCGGISRCLGGPSRCRNASYGGGVRPQHSCIRPRKRPNCACFPSVGAEPRFGAKRLADPDPMVRIGALDMSENSSPSKLWPLASPLLSDSSRGVRIRAAALLAAVPTANQPAADRDAFERAAAEFVEAQRLNADRPEAHTTLRNFYARRGCGDRIQDRAPAQSTVCPCGGKPRRFLPATRTRWRGREHIALIHRRDPK
jgi:predicted CXXCH cytochrome family protein